VLKKFLLRANLAEVSIGLFDMEHVFKRGPASLPQSAGPRKGEYIMAEEKSDRVVAEEVVVRADRQVFTSEVDLRIALQLLDDFRTVRDYALKNTEGPLFWSAYGRVRRLINDRTQTRLFVNYRPQYRRLPAIRVAVVPDDAAGLRRAELEMILRIFEPYRLVHVELAIDFSEKTQ
jgi:hypothetical protein